MDKHISTQFDSDLRGVSTRVLEMGGLVEAQMRLAIEALSLMSAEVAQKAMETEAAVNQFEVDIDRELSSIIARRQPTARDLRLLMAISRITANLERIGDEAKRMAKRVQSISQSQSAIQGEAQTIKRLPSNDLRTATDLAAKQLRKALNAFARLDMADCLSVIKEDDLIDQEWTGFVRGLITYMMEDPRTISASLDLLFIAKAIERVGDHAKNIAESVIYIVKGEDVRHATMAEIEVAVR
jgi:phosphate transport system protein